MNTVVVAGALAGAGVWLVWSGMRRTPEPLAVVLGRLGQPAPTRAADRSDLDARVGASARRLPIVEQTVAALGTDLRVVHRSGDQQAALLVVYGLVGVLWGPFVVGLARLLGVVVPLAIPIWLALLGGLVGVVVPLRTVRLQARERRRSFSHALAAFCDVTGMCLAAGRGVESALETAAYAGGGWAFHELQGALGSAYVRGETPWDALVHLGEETAIADLVELGAALRLAGAEGATVRETVRSKARTLRERLTADAERSAATVTERMGVPATLLLLGFIVFLGFPAIAVLFR